MSEHTASSREANVMPVDPPMTLQEQIDTARSLVTKYLANGNLQSERFWAGYLKAAEQWQAAQPAVAELVRAARVALADFEGPVNDLARLAKVHPYTLTPAQLRRALEPFKEAE